MVLAIFASLGGLVMGLFQGQGEPLQNLTGPIGIVTAINHATSYGVLYLIQFLGVISLNLAVFNLLPIPALDGGRLAFVLVEMVTGKRANMKHETIAIGIGALALILLAVVVTINDIFRLFV